MVSVCRGFSHGGLRKGNPDSVVVTGSCRSPGIAGFTIPHLGWATPSKFELLCDAAGVVMCGGREARGRSQPSCLARPVVVSCPSPGARPVQQTLAA